MGNIKAVAEQSDPFAAFCARFGDAAGESVLERIADAAWNGRKGEGIEFLDVHQINAANHVYSGTIEHAGETFGFIVESGDINGTVVHAWGDPEDVGTYQPPPPPRFDFVPIDVELCMRDAFKWKTYLSWRKADWVHSKLAAYHYDRHFQPGSFVEAHYREWAASYGMRIVSAESAERLIAEARR